MSLFTIRAGWTLTGLLVLIGVSAAIGRSVFSADFITRADPVRARLMDALQLEDPFVSERPRELARMDGRFAGHPLLTQLHVVPGGLFLLFAPLQFSSRIRLRHPRLHRWSGRTLLPLGLVSVATGLYFGLVMPFGGPGEAVAIALFGALFVIAMSRGYLAIRRRQVERHREWMIRVFAIAIAISTVRVVGAVLDITLTPAGFPPARLFVLSVWAGWVITVGAAELWIRHTRRLGVARTADRHCDAPAR